jgi:hypothetical protein
MISKYRPSKVSTNYLEQLSKILSFSTSKTRRVTIKQKRSKMGIKSTNGNTVYN